MVNIYKRILSPTAINTYLSCPYKYYLRYTQKLKSKISIHLIRGRIVHQTLRDFFANCRKNGSDRSFDGMFQKLLEIFSRLWAEADGNFRMLNLPDTEIDLFREESEMMLLNFMEWHYRNNLKAPDSTEFRILSKQYGLIGIIDAVYHDGDQVTLMDYKTSKYSKVTDDILRQAALYALLYFDKFKKAPYAVGIHFLNSTSQPSPIYIDENILAYSKTLVDSIRQKTLSDDVKDYPCTCGGRCKNDFIMKENGENR